MLEQKLHVYDINGTQALKRLDIAWATLRSWTERGALSSYWFGATRYYSSIEVDKLAQELGSLNGSQVAKIFRRHRNTVTRMGDRGELRYSVTPAGQRRYHTADVRLATKPPGRQKGV